MRTLLALLAWLGAFLVAGCALTPEKRPALVRCVETSHHHDGDTFTCVPGQGAAEFVVRVASIDAPETGQAYWRAARARLRELAAPGSAVSCYKVDRFERRVCRLRARDGEDAADVMLSEGLAWYPEEFSAEDAPSDRERYRRLQAEAKSGKRGLWVEPEPMPPRECRQLRKNGARCR
jgi:endonuclease YncB( thermonuclease family)